MYAYFIGKVAYIQADSVVLEVNNIGYNIKVSSQTLQNLGQMAGQVKLYTYTYVKEDTLSLFGFLNFLVGNNVIIVLNFVIFLTTMNTGIG